MGSSVGGIVGVADGPLVGTSVAIVGFDDGKVVTGDSVGLAVGTSDGREVVLVGSVVGAFDGMLNCPNRRLHISSVSSSANNASPATDCSSFGSTPTLMTVRLRRVGFATITGQNARATQKEKRNLIFNL